MRVEDGIRPTDRERAAQIYWAAFHDKLGHILGPEERAIRYFKRTLVSNQAISVYGDDELIGIAGYDLGNGGIIGGSLWDFWAVYGASGFWRATMLMLFARLPQHSTLLVDGIAVAPERRGQGAGTALLHGLYEKAREHQCSSLTLEVINTNPRARELYRREGFEVVSQKSVGFLSNILNFQSSEKMTKTITD